MEYKEVERASIEYLFNGELILVITATDLETKYTHEKIKPLAGNSAIIRIFEGDLTYYIGMLGIYKVAHVQCSMGSLSRTSSTMTVSSALDRLKSKVVIMVGIAFGVAEDKQQVGDVLVSESIIPYNAKRVGAKTIHRGIEAPSSKILLNRFKNIRTTWEYILPNGKAAELIPTRMLSGEELIDNIGHRNKLKKGNPDSKGGEMEGAGVYAACDDKADWIVVKGICDFADGNKGENKEQKQIIAINSALSVCLEVFNSTSAFRELNVAPVIEGVIEKNQEPLDVKDILFDIYDSGKEPFYIHRETDNTFNKSIKQYEIWVFGPPGCGKSNMILRNIIHHKHNFIQISLANCIGASVDDFFREIFYDLALKISGSLTQTEPKNFAQCSKLIVELLAKHYRQKELIIFVEEIPIGAQDQQQEFAEKFFSLLISKNLAGGLDGVKFVLSSITSPTNFIKIFQQKIHQQLTFMSLTYWSKENLESLIDTIEKEIDFQLGDNEREQLIVSSLGSPRFVKKFFRSLCAVGKFDSSTVQFILKETERELSQFSNE